MRSLQILKQEMEGKRWEKSLKSKSVERMQCDPYKIITLYEIIVFPVGWALYAHRYAVSSTMYI